MASTIGDLVPTYVLPPQTQTSRTNRPSGGTKKQKNALPQMFLIAIGKERRIVGCFQLTSLVRVTPAIPTVEPDAIFAVISGACPLAQAVLLPPSDFRFRNVVSVLKEHAELQVRSSAALNGGTLNSNFLAFAAHKWRVWHMDEDVARSLTSDAPPSYFPAQEKHALAIGVDLDVVQSLSEVVHDLDQVVDELRMLEGGEIHGQGGIQGAGNVASSSAPESQTNDAARAMGRLENLALLREGGVVSHTYTPEVILNSLCLNAVLQPSASLADAFMLAAPFFFGSDAESVFTPQAMSTVALPKEFILRDARIKLDALRVLWGRETFEDNYAWRYLSPDGSPQLGWQWLVLREDRFDFSKKEFGSEPEAAEKADFNRALHSRTCHLSVYGRGQGSLVNKSVCVNNIHKMETGEAEKHAALTAQVYGVTSDQGTEKGIADIDTMEGGYGAQLENGAVGAGHLYPQALWMPEALHILFNALESSIKKLKGYEHWLNRLRSLERFLCDKSMRRRFRKLFCQDDPNFLKAYSTVHIDWRWEMLSKALDQLLPIFEQLRARFDLATFLEAEDAGSVDPVMVREAHAALNSEHFFELTALMAEHGKILERFAHRLEGCECHREVWMEKGSHAQKRKRMQREQGHGTCFMKNRQACWFVSVGYELLLREIAGCSSNLVQEALQSMRAEHRPSLVRLQTLLAEALTEEVADKFGFLFEVPYCIIRVYWGEFPGGSIALAKVWAGDAVRKYDAAIRAGKEDKLHRVAHIVLGPGECREQLIRFSEDPDLPLRSFPVAHCMVKRYALIPMCGRRVEGVHAEIKRMGAVARNINPPLISAKLSEPKHLKLLKTDIGFRKFCLQKWGSRRIFDDVLRLVVPPNKLGRLQRGEKINRIYQCSIEDEYRDVREEKQAHTEWLALTASRRSIHHSLPLRWNLGISYFRAKFAAGVVFSLPTALLELAMIAPRDSDFDYQAVDPWSIGVEAGSAGPKRFHMTGVRTTSFFEVVNPNPQRRQNVALHHLDNDDNVVHIVRRHQLTHDRQGGQVNLLCTSRQHQSLFLRTIVNMMAQFLPNLFSWRTVAHGAAQGVRVQPQQPAIAPVEFEQMILPSSSSSLVRVSSASDVAMGASPGIDNRIADEVAHHVLAQVDAARSRRGVQGVSFSDMEGVAWEDVATMVNEGALSLGEDEWGEVIISRREEGIRYLSAQTVGEAIQAMRVDFCVCSSKLDSVLTLIRQGWRHGGDEAVAFVPDGEKCFQCNPLRPASYFTCLVVSGDLFAKGISAIPHDAKDLVYQAMLRFTGEQLTVFLERLARAALDDKWLKQQLKGSTMPAIVDSGDPAEEPPAVEDDTVPFIAPLILAIADFPAVQWNRAKVKMDDGVEHKVIMSHCSEVSGSQRAYINCKVPHHQNCFLWRACYLHTSREDLCAFLLAWAISGHAYPHRGAHMECPAPSDERVAEVKGKLSVVDF